MEFMEREIQQFILYLHNVKKTSNNTELSYKRDLAKFCAFSKEKGLIDVRGLTEGDLNAYIVYLKDKISQGIKNWAVLVHFNWSEKMWTMSNNCICS